MAPMLGMETVGAELSTLKVVLGPAAGARMPPLLAAVPEATEMATVPLPEIVPKVTRKTLGEVCSTTPLEPTTTVPVVVSVTWPSANV